MDFDVYIGRPGKGLASIWGNPFSISAAMSRTQVIERFERFLVDAVSPEAIRMRASLSSLKGKTLGCFCKPAACHGDVLAYYADQLEPGQSLPRGGLPGEPRYDARVVVQEALRHEARAKGR